MKRAVLTRLKDNGRQTLGEMAVFDGLVKTLSCKILEPAWKHNKKNISCIPAGRYEVKKRWSKRFKNHFHVLNVSNRDYILIHVGNFVDSTEGCLLPGRDFVDINNDGLLDVTSSRATLETLLDYLPDTFTLDIVDVV